MGHKLMIKWGYTAVALVGAATLALSACAGSSGPKAGTTVELSADYPTFSSSQELADAATLIVEGTALATESTVLKPRYEGDTPQENPLLGLSEKQKQKAIQHDAGVPATVVTFHVDVVHKGDVKPGQDIQIIQTGGVVGGVTYRVAGDSILEPKTGYLVFGGDSFDGAFNILGGSAGTFRAVNTGGYAAVTGSAPVERVTSQDVDGLTAAGS